MYSQQELVKELVQLTFEEKKYSCVILLCQNPKLFSLLCCVFAKSNLSSPYPVGTNFYYPTKDKNLYRKAKILEVTKIQGETWYKFSQRQGKKAVCITMKSLKDFESVSILAHDQESNNWIEGKNVSIKNIQSHTGSTFPTIISSPIQFDEANSELIRLLDKSSLIDVDFYLNLKEKLKIISEKKLDIANDINRIWINKIPNKIENNNIILLSAISSKHNEFKSDIEGLFLRTELVKVVNFNELPKKLMHLVKITSFTNPLSIWEIV